MAVVRVKICGISDVESALVAAEAGANAIGLIFAPSRRRVTEEQARGIAAVLPPFVAKVGVFVDEARERIEEVALRCGLDYVQLHGQEPPEFCEGLRLPVIKAIRVKDVASLGAMHKYRARAFLLDSYHPEAAGGMGRIFDWSLVVQAARDTPIILSGGLTAENVQAALEQVHPYGVDVSSGVETDGRKDHAKIREFIRRVREWDFHNGGTPQATGARWIA